MVMAFVMFLLLLAGAVCFAFGVRSRVQYNLVAAGLFCWILVPLISAFLKLPL